VTYERTTGGAIQRTIDIEGVTDKLVLRASNVRKERTGVHSTVTIGLNAMILEEDTFNVERREERVRLANAALKNPLALDKAKFLKPYMEKEVLNFCRGLWLAWVETSNYAGWEMGDEEPSAPQWDFPGVVMAGSTGVGFGDAKSGKSTLMRAIAQSLQYDISLLCPTIKQANVVWVNAEEAPEEHRRQFGNINQALGIPRISPVYTVDARGLAIADVALRTKLAVEKHEAKHVFVDSLSRLAQGSNLNDNSTATMLVDALSGLGTSVTWIGHTGQENRHRLAGSRHFLNAARVMTRIQGRISSTGVSPELTRGIRVTMTNANGAAPMPIQYYTLTYHRDYGLETIRRADESEWPLRYCDADAGKSSCGRPTWDGIVPGVGPRCDRHLGEDSEA
jgi:hypothetical protein